MRRLLFSWLLASTWLGCGGSDPTAAPLPGGPGNVHGRIVDSTGTPVPRAEVTIHSDPVTVVSGVDGTFNATIDAGSHELTVTRDHVILHESSFAIDAGAILDLGDLPPDGPWTWQRLRVEECAYPGPRFSDSHVWCELVVEHVDGAWATGVGLDQVSVSESVVTVQSGIVDGEQTVDVSGQAATTWQEAGLFEESATDTQLDIVIVMDSTGSMAPFVAGLKAELHALVDGLLAAHADFRLGTVGVDSEILLPERLLLHGQLELPELRAQIDLLDTAGEWWQPSATYDAITLTPRAGFRDQARKVVVVVTDIVPATVYGSFWYITGSSDVTRPGLEGFLAETGIELFYSRNPADPPNYDYADSNTNPRATETGNDNWSVPGSGMQALSWGNNQHANSLAWPFAAADLVSQLALPARPLARSRYFVAWHTGLDGAARWGQHEQELRVAISVTDPDGGGNLTASHALPIEQEAFTLTVNVRDEAGRVLDDVCGELYALKGGRRWRRNYDLCPDQGQLQVAVVPGDYELELRERGGFNYQTEILRAIVHHRLHMPAADHTINVVVATGEALAEAHKLRGLLRDLDEWRALGDPYNACVEEARDWLDNPITGILADGLTWEEMVALKRLNVALGGYVNLNEFAQLESKLAVEDFDNIVREIRVLISKLRDTHKSTKQAVQEKVTAIALKIIYGILTQGRSEAVFEAIEVGLKELLEYAQDLAIAELRQKVIEEFPTGSGALDHLVTIANTLIDGDFADDDTQIDWDAVLGAAVELGIKLVLEEGGSWLTDLLLDEAFDAIETNDTVEVALRDLVEELVTTVVRADFENLSTRLEAWTEQTRQQLADHGREEVVTAATRLFEKLDAELAGRGVPAEVRDFVVGFARDLALQAIPTIDGQGEVNVSVDAEAVVSLLLKHAVHAVVLQALYVSPSRHGVCRAIEEASTLPEELVGDRVAWQNDMRTDFALYRPQVGDLQADARNALRAQAGAADWAEGMEGLIAILDPLGEALTTIAEVYPPFESVAEAVETLSAVLSGLKVIDYAIAFGMKIGTLSTLGDRADTLYESAY